LRDSGEPPETAVSSRINACEVRPLTRVGASRRENSSAKLTTLDLRSPSVRILCCAACGEPVGAVPSGARAELRCGYCGREDVVELGSPRGPGVERVYRGRVAGGARGAVSLDLAVPPEGLERFARLLARHRADLTRTWREALADATEGDKEDRRLVFLGASLAAVLDQLHHDALRARAVLETTLERARHPALRALVAARLAALAVRCGAPELAEQWLSQIPEDLSVAEVTSARRVAEALMLCARADVDGVLAIVGHGRAAEEFVVPYRWLAVALLMDAHEKRGDVARAHGVWTAVGRGAQSMVLAAARHDALAPRTRRRIVTLGFVALAAIFLLLFGVVSLLRKPGEVALATLALGMVTVIALFVFRWRTPR
jgi:hypothetical protein